MLCFLLPFTHFFWAHYYLRLDKNTASEVKPTNLSALVAAA